MYDLKLSAKRLNGVITVEVSGFLANSCWYAELYDVYPGGGIIYVADPGTAQVFIYENIKPDSEICLPVMVPWKSQTTIRDSCHQEICCYINNKEVARTTIQDLKAGVGLSVTDLQKPNEPIADLISSHRDFIAKNSGWEYRVLFHAKGTRSESADGILLLNGKLITSDKDGEIIDTAFGKMKYHLTKPNLWDPTGWIFDQQYVNSYNFYEIQNRCLHQFMSLYNLSLQDTNEYSFSFLTDSNCRVSFSANDQNDESLVVR